MCGVPWCWNSTRWKLVVNIPKGEYGLFRMCLTNFWTLLLKYHAHVAGSFDISSHLSDQGMLSSSSSVIFFWCIDMYMLQSSFVHLVSAADSDINSVGIPNCQIIAINSFFLCSKYGGLERIFLNILYPSS